MNDNRQMFDEKKVPEAWIMCPPFGDLIDVGNISIIPMKTPLGEKWNEFLYDKHQFTPEMIARELKRRGKHLKCIFSFANSNTRYDQSDLRFKIDDETFEIKQFWIRCNREAPDETKFRQFLDDFNSLKFQTDDVVGIHCTHGFNRTGFIIVRYLVEEQHMGLIDALTEFSKKRHPGIYKRDYVEKLFEIYGLENTWDTPVGTKASWSFPNPNTLPHFVQKEMIHPDTDDAPVVGVKASTYQFARCKSEMMKMCRKKPTERYFPGSQPVTLAGSNENSLTDDPSYVATYKSDGTRYFMLCLDGKCFLVDRKLEFREVNVRLVNRHGENLQRTLLDGELVSEEKIEPPLSKMNFLIFDIVQFEEVDLIDNDWDTRMDYVSKGVIKFREMWQKKCPEKFQNEEFRVSIKKQWPLNQLADLQYAVEHQVLHKTDGIIFTPLSMPYIMGQCDRILKWKPIELNSSDFIALEHDGIYYLAVRIQYPKNAVSSNKPPYADIPVSILDADPPSILEGFDKKIVECSFDVQTKGWFPLRVRTDKTNPNAYSTFVKICVSIQDDITLPKLQKRFQ
ncbi:hypothetical protein M9Y10_005117 [Tritrichomonas musculus]|uniref:mRNA guanylyltransferase n=1 Tax=Tritrichomonas musculus TaxID=1915356 RepID=A0ABR2JKK7_9EUKA